MNKCNVRCISEKGKKYYLLVSETGYVDLACEYLKVLVWRNLSPNTVERVARALSYYVTYLLTIHMDFQQIVNLAYDKQYAHFSGFLQYTQDGRHTGKTVGPGAGTSNTYLKDVFGFYQFLERKDYPKLRVLESRLVGYQTSVGVGASRLSRTYDGYLRTTPSEGKTITKEEIKTLVKACANIRDSLLIVLLSETGFRIGELLGTRYTSDIDYKEHRIYVAYRELNENDSRQKNAEDRSSLISSNAFDMLETYMAEYADLLKNTDYLFVNRDGRPLTRSAVYSMLRQLEKKTGIHPTCHMLRRYFANERRKAGWGLEAIRAALGHRHIATTEAYLHVEQEEVDAAQREYLEASESLYETEELL